jgi:hypothetical protein
MERPKGEVRIADTEAVAAGASRQLQEDSRAVAGCSRPELLVEIAKPVAQAAAEVVQATRVVLLAVVGRASRVAVVVVVVRAMPTRAPPVE